MPELPEVETVVRLIRPRLVGRTVRSVDARWQRTLGGATVAEFSRALVGARVSAVWRRAKYLVFDLERRGKPAGHLVGHLRMSGRMHVEDAQWDPGVHVRLSFTLDDGNVFHFIDVRKFGRLVFAQDLAHVFDGLGDEPLAKTFTPERLHALLAARKRRLKPLLLDQSVVAGLGNIYVDEALHRAKLHPLLLSTRVDLPAAKRLHSAVRTTLLAAIAREGSSFDTFYRTPEGRPGSYQRQFRVYGRGGKPCRVCHATIIKFTVGQRGTHVCPRCQPRGGRVATARRTGSRASVPETRCR
ncbi:MAG TPA: bifunctional DNA-formamidopyrimidine glycosylase/DNA-(apurinic or apyrimidinic site) lyase [Planctomycetota bacterium]|nr:bifunctional DNA-formamidopyrimidine glycosylase/DNA-(apurinic or apyrimidinic site) lyase [Planctomycetota bacterium]